jgi:hypothetical protein
MSDRAHTRSEGGGEEGVIAGSPLSIDTALRDIYAALASTGEGTVFGGVVRASVRDVAVQRRRARNGRLRCGSKREAKYEGLARLQCMNQADQGLDAVLSGVCLCRCRVEQP